MSCQSQMFGKNSISRPDMGESVGTRPRSKFIFKPPNWTACNFSANCPTKTLFVKISTSSTYKDSKQSRGDGRYEKILNQTKLLVVLLGHRFTQSLFSKSAIFIFHNCTKYMNSGAQERIRTYRLVCTKFWPTLYHKHTQLSKDNRTHKDIVRTKFSSQHKVEKRSYATCGGKLVQC